jgi:hypothetical protein
VSVPGGAAACEHDRLFVMIDGSEMKRILRVGA